MVDIISPPPPPLGMCCPVRSCPVTALFPSNGTYLKHYRERHLPNLLKWSSDTCKQNKRAHRFCHGQRATFFFFHIPKLKFISPRDVKVPLFMDRSVNPIGISSAQLLQYRREQKHQEFSQFCHSCLSPAEVMFNFQQSGRFLFFISVTICNKVPGLA